MPVLLPVVSGGLAFISTRASVCRSSTSVEPSPAQLSPSRASTTEDSLSSRSATLLGVVAGAAGGVLKPRRRSALRSSPETIPEETLAEALGEPIKVDSTMDSTGVLRADWQDTAIRRMWTRADAWHVHAISGGVHTLIGFFYLLDIMIGDVVRLNGGQWSEHVPFDLVLASMIFGAINAVSGLQPSLLPRPTQTFAQLLGFGEDGNLQAAGFVNTAGFYFFLTYQSLRVLPEYPSWLQPFDPLLSATAFVSIFHAIFLINSWVSRGKLSREFAIGMSAPLLLNVPVSLHLILQGQWWVEALSTAYPGWPEVFFSANYALAWAGSMVTLVLSLYERKVCDLQQRALLTVFLGLITFTVIPLRAALLVPQWFQGDQMVMLTLNPP